MDSRTKVMLASLPERHRKYLETLREDLKVMKERDDSEMVKEYKAMAKGYIRCLNNSGICDFKTLWCWFTL